MTGAIYLGGGGGAADEEVLWRTMLRGKSRIIYWPFALDTGRFHSASEWLMSSLSDLNVSVEVETWTDLGSHTPEELASTELLFVGGGNTFRLLDHVRNHGFLGAVRDLVAGGGDYYGGSAGALLACADIHVAVGRDENELDLADLTALALVSGFDVLPHFTSAQLMDVQRWSAEHGRVVLGIPERSGIALRDGTAEVVGHEPVWELAGDEVTVREPGERWACPSG